MLFNSVDPGNCVRKMVRAEGGVQSCVTGDCRAHWLRKRLGGLGKCPLRCCV